MNGTASRPARPVSLTTVTVAPEEFPSGKPFMRLPRLVDPHAASFPPSWQENRLSTRKGPDALLVFDAVQRRECRTSRAQHLDPLVSLHFPPDRGASKIRLCVHEAGRRIPELGRQAHDRRRIAAVAVLKIWCCCNGANQNQSRKHPRAPDLLCRGANGDQLRGCACSVIFALDVKTRI